MAVPLCCGRIRSNKELDKLLVPADIDTKTLCKCPPKCIVDGIIDFASQLNRIRNMTTCSAGQYVNQPTQHHCPVCPKWRTTYECKTGRKLILNPREVYNYWNYFMNPRAKFGAIMNLILRQERQKQLDRNLSYLGDGQYVSSNVRFVCTKKCNQSSRCICGSSKGDYKVCSGCSSSHKHKHQKCQKTHYY